MNRKGAHTLAEGQNPPIWVATNGPLEMRTKSFFLCALSRCCSYSADSACWKLCDLRQALRYLVRNTTLPQSIRTKAQLQLARMHCYTRSTQIRNRCIMGGVGRGVFRDFRMGRVGILHLSVPLLFVTGQGFRRKHLVDNGWLVSL
jgi:ribosomal protein S14